MRYITIIPARGGSKRLPDKNILVLKGKPLIAYSIEYALESLPNSEVYVSTDSKQIAAIAEEYGAKVIYRPSAISTDTSTTLEVLQHAVKYLFGLSFIFDKIILLQPTNPLRPKMMLSNAIEILEINGHNSLLTVSPSFLKLGKVIDKRYIPWNYVFGQRSQDLEPLYYENGLLYIADVADVKAGVLIDEKSYPMVVDHIYATIDIDTKEDFIKADFYINKIKE